MHIPAEDKTKRKTGSKMRGRDENYNLGLVLVRDPAVTAERREEQCLRLTQISTKVSPIVDWKYGYRIEQNRITPCCRCSNSIRGCRA